MPIALPHLKFYLDTNDGTVTGATSESKAPTPDNPNFLEKVVMPVNLPENPIFCPALRIAAFDSRLGGASTPNVGNCRVSLTTKCPWSEAYVPPRQLAAPKTSQAPSPPPAAAAAALPPATEEEPQKALKLENKAAVDAITPTTTSAAAATPEATGAATSEESEATAGEGESTGEAPKKSLTTDNAVAAAPAPGKAVPSLLGSSGKEATATSNKGSGQVSASVASDDGSGVPALHVGADGTVIGAGSAAALGTEASDEDGEEVDWMWNEHAATFLNVNYDKLTTAAPMADQDEVKDELSAAVRPVDDGTGVFGDLPK